MLGRVKLLALFVAVTAIGCLSWHPAQAQQTWDQCMQGCKLTAQYCIVIMPQTDKQRRDNRDCEERLRECRHACNR